MIVEISGRQTGKTFRMLRHLVNHIVMGGHAVLVSRNLQNRRHHEKIIEQFLKERYCEDNRLEYEVLDLPYRVNLVNNLSGLEWDDLDGWVDNRMRQVFFKKTMTQLIRYLDNPFYYVDEFCFINREHLAIIDNAYYCTTPHNYNPDANNFLYNLIDYCQQNNVKINHLDPIRQDIINGDNELYYEIVYERYPFISDKKRLENLIKYSPLKKLSLNVRTTL